MHFVSKLICIHKAMQPMPDALGGSGALFCTMSIESNLFKSFFYTVLPAIFCPHIFVLHICNLKGPWY